MSAARTARLHNGRAMPPADFESRSTRAKYDRRAREPRLPLHYERQLSALAHPMGAERRDGPFVYDGVLQIADLNKVDWVEYCDKVYAFLLGEQARLRERRNGMPNMRHGAKRSRRRTRATLPHRRKRLFRDPRRTRRRGDQRRPSIYRRPGDPGRSPAEGSQRDSHPATKRVGYTISEVAEMTGHQSHHHPPLAGARRAARHSGAWRQALGAGGVA